MEKTAKNNNNGEGEDHLMISWFEDVAKNAGQVQTETLRQILVQNYGVEYLRKWLGEYTVESSSKSSSNVFEEMEGSVLESVFRSLVPVVCHADLEPYIERIADGDTSPLLTQQPITTLSLSSGTTDGRQKYVPFTSHSAKTTLQTFRLAAAYRSRVYPVREGGRILEFIYSSKQYKTKGGLMAGTATTHYFASEEFQIKQEQTKSFTCSPEAVISSGDYNQSTYCHLLLGLFYSHQVEFLASTFAYSIVQAFRSFQELWKQICDDIREGTLSSRITIPKVRKSVLGLLSKNPCLASQIEAICKELEGSDWFGLVPRLWPNAKYVYAIMTGSMLHYLKKLRHYAGDLPLVSGDYGSTESWIGVNLDPSFPPEKVNFVVVPTFSYFEFIPLYRQSQDFDSVNDNFAEGEPILLSQVKVGQHYEIVLTTFTGLYRCRLGDVVEVAGFYNETPKLNFICRRKLILTINIDKNTENDLQLVVDRGSQILTTKARAEVVDFTSHATMATYPGHYVIYWEIEGGQVEEGILFECCHEMDKSFMDPGYIVSRKTKSIGPLELRLVERGTFRKILEHFIRNGAALSQFKTPRCTSNVGILRILDVCTVSRFHSTAYG